ncbi:hypothetical protein ACHGLA_30310 [Streptomyces sp. YH02]|uniref:hypothetical protein n=1 Tax=Streptomyces sp. YH02 TaxID=3256999 RepID=UPI003757EEB0
MTMSILKDTLKRVRGMMKESDGKVLQNPAERAEGRRMQEEARGASTERRGGKAGPPPHL